MDIRYKMRIKIKTKLWKWMHISGVGGERERAARYLDSVNSANANF